MQRYAKTAGWPAIGSSGTLLAVDFNELKLTNMEYSSMDSDLLGFGGQNQIVNQQEQNREVNQGGLTQTDSEQTLYGPKEEAATSGKTTMEAPEEKEQVKDKDAKVEARVKKDFENV